MLQKRLKCLQELAEAKPALADVCRFHNDLWILFSNAGPFLQIRVKETTQTQHLEQGFPLLNGTMLEIDKEASKTFFAELLQMLNEHGQRGNDDLKFLQKSLGEGELDLENLFCAALDRDHTTISQTAGKIGIQAALLEYCLITALGAALQNCHAEKILPQKKAEWNQGYCPICGSLPSIAELSGKEGTKHLLCSLCEYRWVFRRLTCVHCGNTNHETLAYFTLEEDQGYRVDICRKCNGYLKVVDKRDHEKRILLEVEDIATLTLDLLAAKEGFSRGRKTPPQT